MVSQYADRCRTTMNSDKLHDILEKIKSGDMEVTEAEKCLRDLPYSDLGFAKIDHHRSLRKGFPEVIYCEGKETNDILEIFSNLAEHGGNVLATRADKPVYQAIVQSWPGANYYPRSRVITLIQADHKEDENHPILVISAGTSDIPVAEEAAVTARIMGNSVKEIYDVGVAGIHRLFDYNDIIQQASVIIVVAGMEGALTSVVAGLVSAPVIGVPTSVGYGSSMGGIAALLGMLNSCSTGISVVNIDNGFGAGYTSSLINRKIINAGKNESNNS
jgi:pyridinium-3,5-biscarboxylic acid mononucleotide synthase